MYTTQDPDIQAAMDEQFLNEDNFFKDNRVAKQYDEKPQAGMVILDPHTSQILALYGGAGEKTGSRYFNRATQLDRHPGSSIKPIAVYGPGIDSGVITAASVVDDIPVRMYTIYDGEDKMDELYPINFEVGQYFGLTNVRTAVQKSRNVCAALIFRDILTPARSVEYLLKVGLDRTNEQYISLALGGPNDGMSPLEMASAYVPFVNRGIYIRPSSFTKVTDSKGKIILEADTTHSIVYKEATAYIMIDLMKGVTRPGGTAAVNIGPSFKAEDGEIPIAGKTGTAQDDRDKWFVGYTPYYVAATWYGYDNITAPIPVQSGEEASKAQKIWKSVMAKVHEGLPAKDFDVPAVGIEKRPICIYSGKIATELCAQDPRGSAVSEELFVEGTAPSYSDLCDVHTKVKICTASKDKWNRYLLAGENCPAAAVVEKILIDRPVPYYPVKEGDPFPEDWAYDIPTAEYCTFHGSNP